MDRKPLSRVRRREFPPVALTSDPSRQLPRSGTYCHSRRLELVELVDETPLERGPPGDGPADEGEVGGAVATDAARDADRSAGARLKPERQLRERDGCVRVGGDTIREGRQFDAGTHACSVEDDGCSVCDAMQHL